MPIYEYAVRLRTSVDSPCLPVDTCETVRATSHQEARILGEKRLAGRYGIDVWVAVETTQYSGIVAWEV